MRVDLDRDKVGARTAITAQQLRDARPEIVIEYVLRKNAAELSDFISRMTTRSPLDGDIEICVEIIPVEQTREDAHV